MTTTETPAISPQHPDARSSRRSLLRLAGAAAAGGAAASLLHTSGASAGSGTMQYGLSNNAGTSVTGLLGSGTITLDVDNSELTGTAVKGSAVAAGTGVWGTVDGTNFNGFAVWADNNGQQGYGAVMSGGQAQLRIVPSGARGPSIPAFLHRRGEIAYDEPTDRLWLCVADGYPGAWRVLGGAAAAGAFHAISPSRVYDSRKPSPSPIFNGSSRAVIVAHSIDLSTGASQNDNVVPADATAITFTLTVVNTVGSGYLTVNEGGNTTVKASTINWSAAGLTLANSSVVKISSSRQVTVICGGTASSTNFIIDVTGYYR